MILFSPVGLFLPCIFKNLRMKTYLLSVFCIIFITEILQLLMQVGRFDVDDIILNFVGAIIAYAIVTNKSMVKLLRKIYIID